MPHEDDERDLIAPLIEGMVEDPPWSTFLARLRARLGADYVSIVFRPHSVGAERKPPGRGKVVHLLKPDPRLGGLVGEAIGAAELEVSLD